MKLNANEWETTVDSWSMFPEDDLIDYNRVRIDDIKSFFHQELQKALAEKDLWWNNHEHDMYEALEETHKEELQKVIDELSQERTGFLDHIAKLEKTHQEELQKARLSIAERVRQGRFSKVANDSWNDDNTFGYKEALKDVAEWLENQSELDQLTSDNK